MRLGEWQAECWERSRAWFPGIHRRTEGDRLALIVHLALALAGEVGEVANEIKRLNRSVGTTSRRELGAELADVFVYLCDLATAAGVDLDEAVRAKMELNERRFGRGPT